VHFPTGDAATEISANDSTFIKCLITDFKGVNDFLKFPVLQVDLLLTKLGYSKTRYDDQAL
jgi:hypothetical protein